MTHDNSLRIPEPLRHHAEEIFKVTDPFAQPELAKRVVEVADATRLGRVRGDVERHPSRVLGNALLNTAWRNGPVENIHAGELRHCPFDRRRVTPAEERELMAFASERLALGMTVCLQFAMERPQRPWPEQVLPYRLGRDAARYPVALDAHGDVAGGTPPGVVVDAAVADCSAAS